MPPADLHIREALPADYPAIARVISAVTPRHAPTPETMAHERQEMLEHPLGPHLHEWLAELEGQVIGYARTAQFVGMWHPDRYEVEIMVGPAFRGRGIGTALADTVETHLRARGAQEILAGGYEDQPHFASRLQQRGAQEVMRYLDNVLDLQAFDFAPWSREAQPPKGVRLLSLAELMAERGEDAAFRAYYAAFAEVRQDVPRPGPATPLPYEDLLMRFRNPHFFPKGIMLAQTDDGEVVAISELWRSDHGPQRLQIGITGTRQAWRRKGLALTLKLAGMRAAKAAGAHELWTGNASNNAPMLALNERLGFRPRPAFIEYRLGRIEEENGAT